MQPGTGNVEKSTCKILLGTDVYLTEEAKVTGNPGLEPVPLDLGPKLTFLAAEPSAKNIAQQCTYCKPLFE